MSGRAAKGGPFRPPRPVNETTRLRHLQAADEAAEPRVAEIYAGLLGRASEHDFDPKLDRVARACAFLGDPQRAYPVIHVAGTNGKTSTARLAESLLRARGLSTGLFTSPHLVSVRERIALDGEPIGPAAFVEAWEVAAPAIAAVDAESEAAGGPRLSFFEALTVLAFVAFADAPIDAAVIEVGMGGRWDSTNVVEAAVSVITPIGLDHMAYLGDTVAEIAGEKAGILKPGGRAVVGRQSDAAAGVIADRAAELGVETAWLDRDFEVLSRTLAVGGQVLNLRGLGGEYRDVYLPLHGPHQGDNAACALAAVELFFAPEGGSVPALPGDVVEEGFGQATSPGRLEVVRSSPPVIVDAAHNPAGAEALVAGLEEAFGRRLIGLVGILADKQAEAILGVLEPVLDRVVITRSTSPRAMDPDELGDIARSVFGDPDRVEVVERLDDALARAMELAEIDSDDLPGALATAVLATGSVTMAAEVRLLLGAK